MRFGIRIDDMARDLRLFVKKRVVGLVGIRSDDLLTVLALKYRKINRSAVDSRGSAGLEAHQLDSERGKRRRKSARGEKSVGAALVVDVADENAAVEISSRANDCRLAFPDLAELSSDGRYRAILDLNIHDLSLHETEIRRCLKRVLHYILIFLAIRLNSLGMHRRALAEIERAGLECDQVCRASHLTAERVDLVDEMTLARAADRGIAGHIRDRFKRHREEHRVRTRSRRRESRLDSRVSCTYYDNICNF